MRGSPMEKRREQQLDDNFIEQIMAEAFGYSDEQLAEELDQIAQEVGESVPEAPEGEFEKIWERVDKRNSGRRGVRGKRLLKILVAAVLLGAMVLSSGMWGMARRTKNYREHSKPDLGNVVVFNNSSDNKISDGLELENAYKQIEEELNMQVMQLSYLPEEFSFYKLQMNKRVGRIELKNNDDFLFFYQGINNNTSSLSYGSDMEEYQSVYNPFLDQEILIYQKALENGNTEFSIRLINDNQYYILQGAIDEEQFVQIVCDIKFKN